MLNMLNNLYKDYIRCPNDTKRQKFKTYRNKLHGIIQKAKRSYYLKKFEQVKKNMRQTWKTINKVIGRTQKQGISDQLKCVSGNIITDPRVISNEFNDFFFVNVGSDLASRIHNTGKPYYDYIKAAHDKSIFMKPIIEDEIVKIIGKI